MRSWNGHDRWRIALLCFSGKNEILDTKNCRYPRWLPKRLWIRTYGNRGFFGLFRQNLKSLSSLRQNLLNLPYFKMYSLNSFNYDLPTDLIAQKPVTQRDRSNLLCLNRRNGRCSHHNFFEIGDFLTSGDALVVNDTEVIPGRLEGKKETGGKVEVLISNYVSGPRLAEDSSHFVCRCLLKASKRPASGSWLHFAEEAHVQSGRE